MGSEPRPEHTHCVIPRWRPREKTEAALQGPSGHQALGRAGRGSGHPEGENRALKPTDPGRSTLPRDRHQAAPSWAGTQPVTNTTGFSVHENFYVWAGGPFPTPEIPALKQTPIPGVFSQRVDSREHMKPETLE